MINLIPPKLKRQRETEFLFDRILYYFTLYLILFCILSAVLYAGSHYIQNNIDLTNKQIDSENKKAAEFKDTEKQIKDINSKLKNVESVESEKIFWSKMIESIAKSSPSNIQIKSITAGTDTKTISLTGYAANRREIAKLKDKMEDSKYFSNVNFTTSNYDETKSIYTFNINCEIEAIR